MVFNLSLLLSFIITHRTHHKITTHLYNVCLIEAVMSVVLLVCTVQTVLCRAHVQLILLVNQTMVLVFATRVIQDNSARSDARTVTMAPTVNHNAAVMTTRCVTLLMVVAVARVTNVPKVSLTAMMTVTQTVCTE